MSVFTPQLKHHILTQYQSHSHTHSFSALAHQYGVKGGRQTIQKWHSQWNGTAASLERKVGSGRPRALSSTQVNDYIRTPIRHKRRIHAAVHYPSLLPSVCEKTGKSISLRTLQNYGKREVGIKLKHTKKRTVTERQSTHT